MKVCFSSDSLAKKLTNIYIFSASSGILLLIYYHPDRKCIWWWYILFLATLLIYFDLNSKHFLFSASYTFIVDLEFCYRFLDKIIFSVFVLRSALTHG